MPEVNKGGWKRRVGVEHPSARDKQEMGGGVEVGVGVPVDEKEDVRLGVGEGVGVEVGVTEEVPEGDTVEVIVGDTVELGVFVGQGVGGMGEPAHPHA